MQLDNHGQPAVTAFNKSRNKDKAMFALKGILQGISADQQLNELELLFLDLWLREQEHLKDDGDTIDLLDLIGDILKDNKVTQSELDQLNELIDDIVEYKATSDIDNESLTNEFLGLLTGIAADNKLNIQEFQALADWLESNNQVLDQWPFDIVYLNIEKILADNIVTEEEREHLLDIIKNITGIRFEESGVAYGMATDFFQTDISHLDHSATYCFTGKFVTGTRKVVQASATEKGGSIKNDVSKEVDYLVIGTLASRDWRFTSHGRKIEYALELQKSGHPITIISERTWLSYI